MSGQDIRTHHQRASVQHIHPNTPSEAIRTTYPDRICCCPGVIIVSAAWAVAGCLFHPNTLSGQDMLSSGTTYSDRICYHPDISTPPTFPPGCLSSGIMLCRHSTQMFHILNFDAGWERRAFQLPRSHISGSSDSAYPESFADILHGVAVFS